MPKRRRESVRTRLPLDFFQRPEPIELGPAPTHQESESAMRKSQAQWRRKLRRLRMAFGIKPGRKAWYELSLVLAQLLFQIFEGGKKGRPVTWTPDVQAMLAGDVYRESPNSPLDAPLASGMARKLAQRTPWRGFLRGWTRGTRGPDPGEALIRQYASIPTDWRAWGRALYRCHKSNGTLENWTRMLELLGSKNRNSQKFHKSARPQRKKNRR